MTIDGAEGQPVGPVLMRWPDVPRAGTTGTGILDGARTRIWTRAELLHEHAACVDDLLAATGAPLTASRRWWDAWLEAYPEMSPWIVARVGEDGMLRALAPLARRHRRGWTEVVMIGDGVSDYTRLPARSEHDASVLAGQIAEHLGSLRSPWTLALRQLPPNDPGARELVARLGHGSLRGGGAAPRTAITSRQSSHYLSRSYRKNARNRFNRLTAAGHRPRVEFVHEPEQVQAVLDEVVRVCRARERQMMGRSHLDDPRQERFFRSVAISLAEQGSLELALLVADDRIAAYQLHLVDRGVYRAWNGHHDPAWGRFSPGHVLDHQVFERVLADASFHEFDWMMGTLPYKLRSATHLAAAEEVVAASSPMTAMAAFGPRRLRQRAVAIAREDERAARVVDRLRQLRRHLPGRRSTATG